VSVTAPEGFVAAGVAAGIKGEGRLDLAIVASEEPVAAASGALAAWRDLLAEGRIRDLTDQRLAGFLGELLIFLDVAEAVEEPSLEMWTGPGGGLHDVVAGGLHVEVKTTTSPDRLAARIHSLAQMETPADDAILFLGIVRLHAPVVVGIDIQIDATGFPLGAPFGSPPPARTAASHVIRPFDMDLAAAASLLIGRRENSENIVTIIPTAMARMVSQIRTPMA